MARQTARRAVWLWTAFGCLIGLSAFSHVASAWAQQTDVSTVLRPTATISAAKRIALVIGNAAYQNVHALQNPEHDAQAMASKLRGLGYEVRYIINADRRSLNESVSQFLDEITPDSEALIYYSGHGVELGGSNYLLPTDIPAISPNDDRMLRSEALNLTELLLEVQEKQARVTLVIVDACRDNPFRVASANGSFRSVGNLKGGLAPVEAPRGTFVIYAAGVGEQAMDNLGSQDTDPNGLFTRKLLALMDQDGLEIRSLIHKLRVQVSEAAYSTADHHSQVPGYYDQLLGDFYFKPIGSEHNTAVPTPSLSPVAPSLLPAITTSPVVSVSPATAPVVANLDPKSSVGLDDCQKAVESESDAGVIASKHIEEAIFLCNEAARNFPAYSESIQQSLRDIDEQTLAQNAIRGSGDKYYASKYLTQFPFGRYRYVAQDVINTNLVVASDVDRNKFWAVAFGARQYFGSFQGENKVAAETSARYQCEKSAEGRCKIVAYSRNGVCDLSLLSNTVSTANRLWIKKALHCENG